MQTTKKPNLFGLFLLIFACQALLTFESSTSHAQSCKATSSSPKASLDITALTSATGAKSELEITKGRIKEAYSRIGVVPSFVNLPIETPCKVNELPKYDWGQEDICAGHYPIAIDLPGLGEIHYNNLYSINNPVTQSNVMLGNLWQFSVNRYFTVDSTRLVLSYVDGGREIFTPVGSNIYYINSRKDSDHFGKVELFSTQNRIVHSFGSISHEYTRSGRNPRYYLTSVKKGGKTIYQINRNLSNPEVILSARDYTSDITYTFNYNGLILNSISFQIGRLNHRYAFQYADGNLIKYTYPTFDKETPEVSYVFDYSKNSAGKTFLSMFIPPDVRSALGLEYYENGAISRIIAEGNELVALYSKFGVRLSSPSDAPDKSSDLLLLFAPLKENDSRNVPFYRYDGSNSYYEWTEKNGEPSLSRLYSGALSETITENFGSRGGTRNVAYSRGYKLDTYDNLGYLVRTESVHGSRKTVRSFTRLIDRAKISQIVDQEGSDTLTTVYQYHSGGLPSRIELTDQSGKKASMTYDEHGRVLTATLNGRTTSYQHSDSQLVVSDPEGDKTTYIFESRPGMPYLVKTVIKPDGEVAEYSLDDNGHPIEAVYQDPLEGKTIKASLAGGDKKGSLSVLSNAPLMGEIVRPQRASLNPESVDNIKTDTADDANEHAQINASSVSQLVIKGAESVLNNLVSDAIESRAEIFNALSEAGIEMTVGSAGSEVSYEVEVSADCGEQPCSPPPPCPEPIGDLNCENKADNEEGSF